MSVGMHATNQPGRRRDTPEFNRIYRIFILIENWFLKNSEVKLFGSEQFRNGRPTEKFFSSAHKLEQSVQKIFVLVCDGSLCFMGACGSGAGAWCTSALRVSARASEMRCWH